MYRKHKVLKNTLRECRGANKTSWVSRKDQVLKKHKLGNEKILDAPRNIFCMLNFCSQILAKTIAKLEMKTCLLCKQNFGSENLCSKIKLVLDFRNFPTNMEKLFILQYCDKIQFWEIIIVHFSIRFANKWAKIQKHFNDASKILT